MKNFDDYVSTGSYNLLRTSCGGIANAFKRQSQAIRESDEQPDPAIAAMADLVGEFSDADDKLTRDIQPVMQRALAALKDIRSRVMDGRTDEARARQETFVREYDAELRRIDGTLQVLADRGNQLRDSL